MELSFLWCTRTYQQILHGMRCKAAGSGTARDMDLSGLRCVRNNQQVLPGVRSKETGAEACSMELS